MGAKLAQRKRFQRQQTVKFDELIEKKNFKKNMYRPATLPHFNEFNLHTNARSNPYHRRTVSNSEAQQMVTRLSLNVQHKSGSHCRCEACKSKRAAPVSHVWNLDPFQPNQVKPKSRSKSRSKSAHRRRTTQK